MVTTERGSFFRQFNVYYDDDGGRDLKLRW